MKTFFTVLSAVILAASLWAQSPQKMSYQAVIRDASNNLVTGHSVGIRVSVLQGSITGTEVYKEIYNPNPQTNANGLVNIEIGSGIPIKGTIASINWTNGPYYIKTETDPTGGTNYTITGTSQLLSVPYALHSKTAESLSSGIIETDPTWRGLANDTADIGRTGSVGIGITSPAALLHTQGTDTGQGNVVFVGERKLSNPGNPPITNTGTRMMWYPDKAAFRAGFVISNLWDADSIGYYSSAFGESTTASGYASNAMGSSTTASGYYSIAMGAFNIASNTASNAMGFNTSASGRSSTAMGEGTIASSCYATALGSYNVGGGNPTFWIDTDPLFEIGNGSSKTYPSNAMTVLKNGYVGIGTASPAAGLHLKANGWPGSFIYLDANTGEDAGLRFNEGSTAKWHIYNSSAGGGLRISNSAAQTAIFVNQTNSNVGIGTTIPSYTLQVGNPGDGTQARANAWNLLSDARLKRDFTKLMNPLEIVKKINGYYFYWDTGIDKTRQVGFSAQEILNVLPEVVSRGEDGYLSIEYGKMTPLLIEAVKELKAENDRLKIEIQQINTRLENLEKLEGDRAMK